MIGRLNYILLNRFLFPDFLENNTVINFVDPRLTAPKAWRDVYQYDHAGRLSGWIRYDGKNRKEFNAEGHLILEHKPLRTQPVRYRIGPFKMLEARPMAN